MIKQIERQVRDLQKESLEVQRERDSLRLQPCRGDVEIRKKEDVLRALDQRLDSLHEKIRELERKRREMMSEAVKKTGYESPFH
jgi:chromosome segregation ATPase